MNKTLEEDLAERKARALKYIEETREDFSRQLKEADELYKKNPNIFRGALAGPLKKDI